MFFESAKNIAIRFKNLEKFETRSEQQRKELEEKDHELGQLSRSLSSKIRALNLSAAGGRK